MSLQQVQKFKIKAAIKKADQYLEFDQNSAASYFSGDDGSDEEDLIDNIDQNIAVNQNVEVDSGDVMDHNENAALIEADVEESADENKEGVNKAKHGVEDSDKESEDEINEAKDSVDEANGGAGQKEEV